MKNIFEDYYETYKNMLKIIRKPYINGYNYYFLNGSRIFKYREHLNEETVKPVYIMFCKYLFEHKDYNQRAHLEVLTNN